MTSGESCHLLHIVLLTSDVSRGKPPQAGKHWSAEPPFGFGQRARFRVPAAESFTALVIKDVTLLDEGVYRCRVDYRNSPTRNMKLNLTVVGKNLVADQSWIMGRMQ